MRERTNALRCAEKIHGIVKAIGVEKSESGTRLLRARVKSTNRVISRKEPRRPRSVFTAAQERNLSTPCSYQ